MTFPELQRLLLVGQIEMRVRYRADVRDWWAEVSNGQRGTLGKASGATLEAAVEAAFADYGANLR